MNVQVHPEHSLGVAVTSEAALARALRLAASQPVRPHLALHLATWPLGHLVTLSPDKLATLSPALLIT